MTTRELFARAYAATNGAADLTQRMDAEDAVTVANSKRLMERLTEASCAARELDNRLAGNPPARRGD